MFMSDNGGFSNGAQWRGGELFTHNAPLRSGKGSAYEGGIRVPMIVKYPGKTAAASVCKQPVMIEDFFPSILEMAGIKKPEIRQEVDGKSFVSLLEGKKMAQRRSFFWHYPNLWDGTAPGVFPSSTILKGNMKLIYNYETGGKELYNLAVDLSETHNLANEDPVLLKKLSKELGQYLRKVKAQRPVIKATGKLAPWPDEI
jgi:arylsulfatase A-like enzyme